MGVSIKISYLILCMLALFSFNDENHTFFTAFFASIMHETGHIIAAVILSLPIKSVAFLPFGIRLELKCDLEIISTKKKLTLLFAGPFLNLFCFAVFYYFGRQISFAAVAHLAVGAFNLMPISTLDGGRILKELLSLKVNEITAEKICDIMSIFLSGVMLVLGTLLLVYSGYNVSLLFTAIYLAIFIIIRQKKLN